MIKVCATCGQEFETRPVYHNCPTCREAFNKKMDKLIEEEGL